MNNSDTLHSLELANIVGELSEIRLEFAVLSSSLTQINGLDEKTKELLEKIANRNEERFKKLKDRFDHLAAIPE
jgi:hypothetical protein